MTDVSNNFFGNPEVLNNLYESFVNKSLHNSIILSGPKGIGKNTLAFYLINKIFQSFKLKSYNQTNLIYKNHHPNFKYITKEFNVKTDKTKNNITFES